MTNTSKDAPAASPDAADRPPAAHTAPARPATGSGPTTRKGPPQGLCEAVLIAEQHMRVTRLSVDEARSVFHEIVRLLTSALKEI